MSNKSFDRTVKERGRAVLAIDAERVQLRIRYASIYGDPFAYDSREIGK